ncbi:hypothetical protein AMJ80_10930 [bacterium SM23_31]|nr:MAG: hypothetical protein AMJ80_10930 [bacterium SM23_31]
MRRISIEILKPGMKLSLPIRDENHNLLLNRNVALTERYIQRLKNLGFQSIYIADPDLLDITHEDMISNRTRSMATKHLNYTYREIENIIRNFKNESIEKITTNLRSKSVKKAFNNTDIHHITVKVVDNIIDDVVSCAVLTGLNPLKTHDNYTFNHSIEVAIVSIMIGKKLKLNARQLRELATGCLLHDVGKVFIPAHILNKPDKLSFYEFELVKEHPVLGYEMLRDYIPIMPTQIAYQHHERQDGSGYPRGLIGYNSIKRSSLKNQIAFYGEIVAIADVYDALISDRPYRTGLMHDRVLDIIKNCSHSHFNAEIVDKFLSIVPRYPVGSTCEITSGKYTGYHGVVVYLDENNLNIPKIRLLYDTNENRIKPINIDLQKECDTHVELVES